MPWNQSGSGDKDPWGQGNGQNQPPDLDEVLKDIQKKFSGIFGGKGGGGGKSGGNLPSFSSKAIAPIAIIVLGLWFATGFYVVEQGQQAVEMRFGAYKTIKEAGLRWHMPYPIEISGGG